MYLDERPERPDPDLPSPSTPQGDDQRTVLHSWTAAAPTPRPPAESNRAFRAAAVGLVMVVLAVSIAGGFLGGWLARPSTSTTEAVVVTTLGRPSSAFASGSRTIAGALNAVEPAVVSIGTTYTLYRGPFNSVAQGAGTGMTLSSDGYVLTNAHVISSAGSITVTLPGSTTARPADLIGQDTAADIAVIKIRGVAGLPVVPLGDATKVQVGDDVIAIGNALALSGGPTVSRGIISALNRSIDTDSGTLSGMTQTDAAISSGNSGGPLVDAAGQVIGMDTAVASSSDTNTATNIGFAIPINTAITIATRLRRG